MTEFTEPVMIQPVAGSDRPARIYLAPTLDGLYTPYALRTPADEGVFPFVFLAYGNGGGGIPWLLRRLRTHGYIMDRLLAAGYACAWGRYRTEVELGYHNGGPLIIDRRQGMDLMNRGPLEFEDELAVLRHAAALSQVDAGRLGHVGVSHAGEMLFKLASQYPGVLRPAWRAAGQPRVPQPDRRRDGVHRPGHRPAQHRGDADAGPRAGPRSHR